MNLIIKIRQAELAMSAQSDLLDPARKADPSWQDEYHLRMKELNRRGGAVVVGD